VRLEPLSTDHDEGLWDASRSPEVWTWVSEQPATRDSFGRYLDAARAATAARSEFAFATVDARDGRPIGMTRYMVLRPDDRGLEIGSTWLTPAAWKTGANVEAKLLQLGYAFETLAASASSSRPTRPTPAPAARWSAWARRSRASTASTASCRA
jgi:RimJ/RimL family protein N-acetyltransferase